MYCIPFILIQQIQSYVPLEKHFIDLYSLSLYQKIPLFCTRIKQNSNICNKRYCFNDPAWESSGWGGWVCRVGRVGWLTYQLPLSSSPVAGSTIRFTNLVLTICCHTSTLQCGTEIKQNACKQCKFLLYEGQLVAKSDRDGNIQ